MICWNLSQQVESKSKRDEMAQSISNSETYLLWCLAVSSTGV